MGTLKQRFYAKVRVNPSDPDGCWEWTASFNGRYGQFGVGGTPRLAHRVAYEILVGPIPGGYQIDHRCRNTACVNPEHLRPATPSENQQNRGLDSVNTSGFRGVSFDRATGKFAAKVKHGRKTLYVGQYLTAQEAGAAAKAKRLELFTHNEMDRL